MVDEQVIRSRVVTAAAASVETKFASNEERLVVDLAEDEVLAESEVFTGGELFAADGACEAVDVVDVVVNSHDELVGGDGELAVCTELHHVSSATSALKNNNCTEKRSITLTRETVTIKL